MSVLGKKLRRELVAERGQSLAVLLVTALGVMLFVATGASYADLERSYAHSRARLALADWHLEVAETNPIEIEHLRREHGILAAAGRVRASLPVRVGGDAQKLELRILSVPDGGRQPTLDRLLLVEGALPSGDGEIVLEKHLAAHKKLHPGALVHVDVAGVKQDLKVVGVAVSAQYLWVSRDENDVMPSPDAFGVGFMTRSGLRALAEAVTAADPRAAAGLEGIHAAAGVADNEVLVADRPAASAPPEVRRAADDQAIAAVKNALGPARVLKATRAEDLVGLRLLQMDLDGFKGMAAFFPLFFLAVAGFIAASVLSRLIDAQRAAIGTLLALGVPRRRVLVHYLEHALVLGVAGAVAGIVLGVPAALGMTSEYAVELGIPFVTTRLHPDIAGLGLAFGVVVALVAGWLPAWRASRLLPAEAMRPSSRYAARRAARVGRGLRLPLPLRMAVRGVLGRPLRSLGTALGVAAALVLVLTSGALMDSIGRLFDVLVHDARNYSVRVDLVAPVPADAAIAEARRLPAVTQAEPVLMLPGQVIAHGKQATTLVQGVVDHARLLRAVDVDGREVPPPAGGVVLTRALAQKIGVGVGDDVVVRVSPMGVEHTFRLAGFADAALGATASVRREDLAFAVGDVPIATGVALVSLDAKKTEAALATRTDVARIEDLDALRATIGQVMAFGWVFIAVMLLCCVVLAAAILFNTATISVVERRRELATLRALGRTMKEITLAVTAENALLALLGLVLGFPLGLWSIHAVLALYSSDLFAMPFVLSPVTVGVTVLGIVLILFFAQRPALKAVERTRLAEPVRDV